MSGAPSSRLLRNAWLRERRARKVCLQQHVKSDRIFVTFFRSPGFIDFQRRVTFLQCGIFSRNFVNSLKKEVRMFPCFRPTLRREMQIVYTNCTFLGPLGYGVTPGKIALPLDSSILRCVLDHMRIVSSCRHCRQGTSIQHAIRCFLVHTSVNI